MAADRSRLAAALAYRQAEEERRRRMMESVPGLVTTPAQPAPRADFRTNLENLSIGLGEGLTNQLEGIKGIITDPVGTAKGVYEAGRAVIRDPSVIADALRYTAQKATSGSLGAGEVIGEMLGPRKGGPMMQELDVYHGTPHRFPATEANPLGEFDASKIGTGEGAQAYGHGIYYAESPRVAEDYRRSTSRSRFLTDNGYFDPSELEHLHVKVKARHGNIDEAIETAKKYVIPDEDYPEVAAKAARDLQKLEALKARGGYRENPGALYKADLPDEMIDRMLDWDKPIKDQPEAVRKAIDRIESEFSMRKQPYKDQEGTGFWYGALTDTVGGQQNASKLLKEYGVPGIKYADAGSRGQGGSGTHNFVVFPGEEKKVRILERK